MFVMRLHTVEVAERKRQEERSAESEDAVREYEARHKSRMILAPIELSVRAQNLLRIDLSDIDRRGAFSLNGVNFQTRVLPSLSLAAEQKGFATDVEQILARVRAPV